MRKIDNNIFLKTIFVLLLFIGVFYLSRYVSENNIAREIIGSWGYYGLFVISAISGFNLAVPIPAIVFLPVFLEIGHSFWLSIFIISFGMTIGDTVGFLLGKMGRDFATPLYTNRYKLVIEIIHEKLSFAPYILIFLYASFVPFPNELLVIPLAFAGYKLKYIFPAVIFGNFIFNSLYAYGITNVFNFISSF